MATIIDPEKDLEQTMTQEEQSALLETVHKLLLLYVGFFALAIEEIEALAGRLIERGEMAEQDSRKLLRGLMDKRKAKAYTVENYGNQNAEGVKSRMTLASKADIVTLNEQLTRILEQLEELNTPEPRQ